ncbi:MAG: hypothetical protein AAB116_15700, partial [Candidatus Poribacteria bacterium]
MRCNTDYFLHGSPSRSNEKHPAQLRVLNEISAKLQNLLKAENFYQEIINIIQCQFNYYCTHIWKVCGTHEYILQAQAGAYRGHFKLGYKISTTKGITSVVVKTGKSYICNDVKNDQNYTDLSLPVDTKSELCV